MAQAEESLTQLQARIEEQMRAAKKRQHTRLANVLHDCYCVVGRYRTLVKEQGEKAC
jgi:hypothetical protein